MIYNIRVYFGTGFDTVNVPDSPNLLETSATSIKDYNTNYLVQNTDFTTVRLADSFDNLKNGDYLRIGTDRYYSITGINMLSDATAELSLSMDYMLSMGGIYSSNFAGFGATATRLTPANPSTDYNYLSEPFTPSQPLDSTTLNDSFPSIEGSYTNDSIPVIGSTVDLMEATTTTARAFINGDGEEVGYFPELPQVSEGTTITATIDGTQRSYKLPNERLYYFSDNENFIKMITAVQSLGISDAIIDRVSYPNLWNVCGIQLEDARLTAVTGREVNLTVPAPTINRYTPHNRKTAELFAQLSIFSQLSGDSATFGFGEIKTPGQETAIITGFSDPSPKGRPYVGPKYYHGAIQAGTMQKVQGAQWYTPAFSMPGSAGSAIRNYSALRDLSDVKREQGQVNELWEQTKNRTALGAGIAVGGAVISGLIGNVGGLVSSGDTLLDLATNYEQKGREYEHTTAIIRDKANDIATASNIANSVYVPTYKSADGNNLSLLMPNSFRIITTNLGPVDARVLDNYLTKFGYAVPAENVNATDLQRGRYFCYIQAGEINFGNSQLPKYIRNGAISQLLGGVRIWHVKPSNSYYSLSNEKV